MGGLEPRCKAGAVGAAPLLPLGCGQTDRLETWQARWIQGHSDVAMIASGRAGADCRLRNRG